MTQARLDQLRVKQLKFLGLLQAQGSLAATAESLFMTPSAASMMLKDIEGLFGAKLFQRQGMVPTAYGLALLPRCQTVLGEVRAMSSALGADANSVLRIGAFAHTTTTVLPHMVKKLLTRQPTWQIQVIDGSAKHLWEQLLVGDIDLLIGRAPQSVVDGAGRQGLAQRVLYDSKLSVVSAANHPLTLRRKLQLSDLHTWRWILPSAESTTRTALADEFFKRGLTPPTPVVESPSFFYSLSIVAHTDLLTCCAHTAALHSGHATSILPIALGAESTPVALFWRKDSQFAQLAAAELAD
jgi:DNA-binding transcriptional LysR family regulator